MPSTFRFFYDGDHLAQLLHQPQQLEAGAPGLYRLPDALIFLLELLLHAQQVRDAQVFLPVHRGPSLCAFVPLYTNPRQKERRREKFSRHLPVIN